MNQRTHSWIAIRAIALLEDEGQSGKLVELLKPHARRASAGAWIPDQIDAKRGGAGSRTDNHILKIEPYQGTQAVRFTTKKDTLLEHTGMRRLISQFLLKDVCLDELWWAQPYRGDVPKPGQHLPNRIMALCTMMKDLLLMGNPRIDALVPGSVRFIDKLDGKARTTEEAAALYFFMLSHFVADVCMPCHCDARKVSAYDGGMHKELETHWSKLVGTTFEDENLLDIHASGEILEKAREVDAKFNVQFEDNPVPDLLPQQDPWLESMYLCRASFAIASIIVPYQNYPYDNSQVSAEYAVLLGDGNPGALVTLDQMVMHDAVLNTAIFWKHIWNKIAKD